MDVKEAIDILNKYIEHPWSIEVDNADADKFQAVIKLLQQGEALEKILNKLIQELEKEMIHSREADQFGYTKQRAIEVYHSVIKRLKEINVPKEAKQDEVNQAKDN